MKAGGRLAKGNNEMQQYQLIFMEHLCGKYEGLGSETV